MSSNFGSMLKHWRGVRRFSQLALSHESGFSSRHISFLETGRSNPSRGIILALGRVLEMPKSAVNDALLSSGFAPEYPSLSVEHSDMEPVRSAVQTILDNHAPMPAITIDSAWNITGGNFAAMQMVGILPFNGSLNLVDALLNDNPDEPQFLNWSDIATWTALRLQVEAAKQGHVSALRANYERLVADPRLDEPHTHSFSNHGPILTAKIKAGDTTLTLFTMLAEFSTVQDVTMSDVRVELFFPADKETKDFFIMQTSSENSG